MGHSSRTALAVTTTILLAAAPAAAQQTSLNVGPNGAITFTPGLRLQPRFTYDNADANNDFFIARVRFKGSGNAFGIATYGTELKLDNVGPPDSIAGPFGFQPRPMEGSLGHVARRLWDQEPLRSPP